MWDVECQRKWRHFNYFVQGSLLRKLGSEEENQAENPTRACVPKGRGALTSGMLGLWGCGSARQPFPGEVLGLLCPQDLGWGEGVVSRAVLWFLTHSSCCRLQAFVRMSACAEPLGRGPTAWKSA